MRKWLPGAASVLRITGCESAKSHLGTSALCLTKQSATMVGCQNSPKPSPGASVRSSRRRRRGNRQESVIFSRLRLPPRCPSSRARTGDWQLTRCFSTDLLSCASQASSHGRPRFRFWRASCYGDRKSAPRSRPPHFDSLEQRSSFCRRPGQLPRANRAGWNPGRDGGGRDRR